MNDNYSFILTDMGLGTVAPVKNYGHLAWFWLKFNDPRDDGFYKKEESETIFEIEDRVNAMLEKQLKPLCMGSITGSGRREVYYYLSDPKRFNDIIEKVMKGYPSYKYQIGIKPDEKWEQYFNVLYPTEEQYQTFKDLKVLDALLKNGDELAKKRLVSHWSYFPNETLRAQFIEEITKQGFEIQEDRLSFHSGQKYPYGVMYERIDLIDNQSVSGLTLPLLKLSQKHQGEYDGWESPVITGSDSEQ
jgi:hypothetical protein